MIINKNRRRIRQTKCQRLLLIRLNPRFGLLALNIFFESIDVQAEHSSISVEQYPHVWGLAPNGLFSIKQVVHLPKTALQTRSLGCQCCFARVLMIREREVPEDNTQTRTIIPLELVDWVREISARRTLKVSEFHECHQRVGASTNVKHLCAAHC